jgi:hypothetical protein
LLDGLIVKVSVLELFCHLDPLMAVAYITNSIPVVAVSWVVPFSINALSLQPL